MMIAVTFFFMIKILLPFRTVNFSFHYEYDPKEDFIHLHLMKLF